MAPVGSHAMGQTDETSWAPECNIRQPQLSETYEDRDRLQTCAMTMDSSGEHTPVLSHATALSGPGKVLSPGAGEHVDPHHRSHAIFAYTLLAAQAICTIFFVVGVQYGYSEADAGFLNNYYSYYIGIAAMMLLGFGYLMTFLRWYGIGAISFTFLITCLGLEWSLLTEGFWHNVYSGSWHKIELDITATTNAMFAVAAILISFGGVIGKVSPLQITVMVLVEAVCYTANKILLVEGAFAISDVGGTIWIHMFGAYFGLAMAYVLGVPADRGHACEKPGYVSNIFAMVGTIILWLYWPSFIAGPVEPNSAPQLRALTNTIFSLAASTIATFAVSVLTQTHNKIQPVHIQNATLAGGVAIGAVADMSITVGGAMFIGGVAGVVSTLGYAKLQHKLLAAGLHDTCGIHNLHGMPSVIGGIASIIVAAIYMDDDIYHWGSHKQASMQLAAIACTVAIGVVTGALTGRALKTFEGVGLTFNDDQHWEVGDDAAAKSV